MSAEIPKLGSIKDPTGAARLAIAMCRTFFLDDPEAHDQLWAAASEDERFGAASVLTMWTAQFVQALGISWESMSTAVDVIEEAKRRGR